MATLKDIQAQVAQDEEHAVVPIVQKDGTPYLAADGSPCTITVLGSESAAYRKAQTKVVRALKKLRRLDTTEEQDFQHRVDMAASAVVDWHGWEDKGQVLPCTPANVGMVVSHVHILEQVEQGIREHADFLRGPSAP